MPSSVVRNQKESGSGKGFGFRTLDPRAAGATVRNIAEGANRAHPRDKAARFVVARGEVAECEAALEMVQVLHLAPSSQVERLRRTADRAAAMIWGLVKRERARAAG